MSSSPPIHPLYRPPPPPPRRLGGEDAELYEGDAAVTLKNGEDFEARSDRINATTDALVRGR